MFSLAKDIHDIGENSNVEENDGDDDIGRSSQQGTSNIPRKFSTSKKIITLKKENIFCVFMELCYVCRLRGELFLDVLC